MQGIIRIPEDSSFEDIDGFGQISPTMMVPSSSAIAPVAPPSSSSGGFTSILSTFSQIAQAGAAAYGAYQGAKKPKTSTPTFAPMTPSFAPATPTGMDPMTMLMIGGGVLLVLGLGAALLMMKKPSAA